MKNKLFKFALIPFALLLLLFTTDGYLSDHQTDGLSVYERQTIDIPDCGEVYQTYEFSGELDTLECDEYYINVPATLSQTFIYIERNIRSCEELAMPLIWFPPWMPIPPDECVGLAIYDGLGDLWTAEDCDDTNTYGDGDSFWANTSVYTLEICSLEDYTVCYDITVEVWGCTRTGADISSDKSPKPS